MKKILVILTIISALFSSCLMARELDAIKKNGTIRIAVDTTYPPMEFEADDGTIVGLDVDLAREIAKILKVNVEFITMPWDGILAGLKSNRYDIIMSSMNITPERSQQVNFVPYIMMGQVFVSKKNGKLVKTEKGLKGMVVAVQADTTSHSAVENFKNNGIAMKEIKAFKGATETFSALKSNQAEIIVIDEAVGHFYASQDQKTFTISGEALKPEPIGIAVNKSDTQLQKELSAAVKTIKENGVFDRVYTRWLKTSPKK